MAASRPDRPIALGDTEDVSVAFRPWAIALAAVLAVAVALAPLPALSPNAHRVLTIVVAVVVLWFTEAVPVVVPALLIPVLAVLLGAVDARTAFSGFGDPIVFLFFGTFLLTEAAAQHGLNARLAHTVLGSRWVRAHPRNLLFAIALLGCGISAWVNNTATTALLLPLALTSERFRDRPLLVGTLLMAAYGPSLGGFATPVGSAPNLIGLRLIEEFTGERPSFARWMALFAPLAVLFTLGSAWWVGRGAGRLAVADADPWTREPGRHAWSLAERLLVPVMIGVVVLWIGPGLLQATPLRGSAALEALQRRLPEAVVPMCGALLLFLLPAGRRRDGAEHDEPAGTAPGGGNVWLRGTRILDVSVFRRVDWGTLLLFGGGLSLGQMMFSTGLARWLGEAVSGAAQAGPPSAFTTFLVVLAATALAVAVSEITSNTASAALVVPVVLALAQAAGVDPLKPALAATVGCSFGFMLPVSTPPNALVYGTGRLRIREMISRGCVLDVAGVLVVSVWVTLFA